MSVQNFLLHFGAFYNLCVAKILCFRSTNIKSDNISTIDVVCSVCARATSRLMSPWEMTHIISATVSPWIQSTPSPLQHPSPTISPSSVPPPHWFAPSPPSILCSLSLPRWLPHPPGMAAAFACGHYITTRAALLLIPWQPALSTHTPPICMYLQRQTHTRTRAHMLVFMHISADNGLPGL